MTKRLFGRVGAVALAILVITPAFPQAQSDSSKRYEIEFTSVVDSTNGFGGFGNFPAINNHGDVAFVALHNGTQGVFRAREEGEKLVTIADGSDISAFGDDVAVNASGLVAFDANTATNSRAIFKGDGTFRTLIADSAVNGFFKISVGQPSINAAGTVAFQTTLAQHGFPAAVFTGNGGPLTTIAATSASGFTGFQNVAINDYGTVVFAASQADGTVGVFVPSGRLIDIVDTTHNPEFGGFGDPVINNAGTVADVGFLIGSNAPQIFTGTARGITPRNNPANPPFMSTEHPSLNNQGAVAFSAIVTSFGATGPTGIFLEVSGGHSLIPVVRPGDKLFGSTVDHVDLGRFALNDRFQMAFSYTLTDGRSGVAIASFDGEGERDDRSH